MLITRSTSLVKKLVSICFAVFLIYFFINPNTTYAVSVNISNIPNTITDQSFSLSVTVDGAQQGINYLRIDLFQPSTTKYFGYTHNGTEFYNGSDYSQYLPININSSGSWSGTIQGKADLTSSNFNGQGQYNLKVRRYTQSGSSYTWSNEVALNITNIPSASPSATPQASPTSSSSPNTTIQPSTTPSRFVLFEVPSSTTDENPFIVKTDLFLSNNPNTKFYLKGAFIKSGKSNYFGLNKVDATWIKNSDNYSKQKSIKTDDSGFWSGKIEMMVDKNDNGYEEDGEYLIKIARYTENGNGPSWSNEHIINITSSSSNQTTITSPSPSTNIETPADISDEDNSIRKLSGRFYNLGSLESTVAGETTVAKNSSNSALQIASKKIIPNIF